MFKSIITLLTLILTFLVSGCSEKKDFSQAAKERRFIAGEMSIDNAMKLIFGSYNTDGNYSLWRNIKVPNGLDLNGFFPYRVTGNVKKILFLPFEENKTKKYIMLIDFAPINKL